MLAIWKSHYSLGHSILTLEKFGKSIPGGPDSIVDLAVAENLKTVVLVEDNFTGFLEANQNLSEKNIKLIYGIRFNITEDLNKKDEASFEKTSKIIVFIKNERGYKRLIKIWGEANHNGFYYEPRLDFNCLKKYWNEDELSLAVPFYDSFLFNNTLKFASCVPDFSFTKPVFFLEDNGVPFDYLVAAKVNAYCKSNDYKIIPAKSIYYAKRSDFKSYLTFRCIHNRKSFNKVSLENPSLEHCSSSEFCLESWKENI